QFLVPLSSRHIILLVFFFQAEDGIRDFHVTGVQTCALPIYDLVAAALVVEAVDVAAGEHDGQVAADGGEVKAHVGDTVAVDDDRSEERRVGKECRSRRAPYREKIEVRRSGSRRTDVAILKWI